MERTFGYYLQFHVRPVIRENTEPYEILSWYTDAIDSLLDSFGHELEYTYREILDSKWHDPDYLTVKWKFEEVEFHGLGVQWLKTYNKNYQKWMHHILFRFVQLGVSTEWDMAEQLDEDMECEYPHLIHDPNAEAEDLELAKEEYEAFIHDRDLIIELDPGLEICSLKKIQEPKDDREERMYRLIHYGLEIIKEFERTGLSLYHYTDPEAYNDGSLSVDRLFMLFSNYGRNGSCEFTEKYIVERWIDDIANQVGISPYTCSNHEREFDFNEFDFNPIMWMHDFFLVAFEMEQKCHKI